MRKRRLSVLLLLLILRAPSHATAAGIPRAFDAFRSLQRSQKELLQGSVMTVPLAEASSILEEHADHLGLHLQNTKYVAAKDVGDFDAVSEGQWADLGGGAQLWSLTIRSPRAQSQMVLFSEVALHGGELIIYSAHERMEYKNCWLDCMWVNGTRVAESGKLTSIPISGGEMSMLYYNTDPGGSARGAFRLRVLSVMQEVQAEALAGAVQTAASRRLLQEVASSSGHALGTMLPVHLFQQNSSSLMQCTPSIECQPQYEHLASGVVSIYAVDPKSKTIGLCSGSTVRSPESGTRYILTADHCLRNKTNLAGFEFWLVIFNYQAPCGWSPIPPINDVIQGVRMAYYNFDADVLLLTISNVIPDHFRTYELGFDASSDAVPEQAIGIHHPGGVPTAISTVGAISTSFPPPNFPSNNVQPTDKTHLQITWANGATIGGSSGSPLINVATQRVVGVLTGGYSNCQFQTRSDYYGRLSACWEQGLYQYLSSKVQLEAGSDYAKPSTLSLMRAQNTAPGTNETLHGPSLGFYPTALHYFPNITYQTVTYYLTDPPQGNTILHLRISIINQRGNAIDIIPHVLLGPRERYFTAADYGLQFTTFVNLTGFNSSGFPADLLRFAIEANITSTDNPDLVNTVSTKGIIQNAHHVWNDFAPVVIPQLPFMAKHPITSPSGQAVFQVMSAFQQERDAYVDLVVCLKPEIGIPHADGTVTAYRNDTFIWTLTPYSDPFGTKSCVYVPSAMSQAQEQYSIVISDVDDLNAVLNISTVQLVYLDFANASIASNLVS